ncbi:FecR domain-containing protein [Rapidithrix thailandica]|uniref:FecR domain-containing protein n=1 Tax=Rapidithrix thailandica TaxID=413964 RepID=A0AAW9SB73_9BACT
MDITPELLAKYVNGDCTEAEARAVEQWLNYNGGLEGLKDNVETSPHLEEKLWKNIKTATIVASSTTRKSNFFRMKSWSVAASITIIIAITSYLLLNQTTMYKTNTGEVKTVMLSDSTKVILNVASSLQLSNGFGKSNRKVTLNGEAYFEVKKDSLLPFIINTHESVTKVLGTKFNLSAYVGEANTLTLDEGTVFFYDKRKGPASGLPLTPNEQVVLQKDSLIKNTIHQFHHAAWINRKLVFENQSFALVVKELERFYGYTIEVKKQSLNTRRYNGTHSNQSIEALLQDIGFVLDFKFRKTNNRILIF